MQTLIEHWDGQNWSVVSSPSPGTSNNTLFRVSAVAANDVWAVGYQNSTGGMTFGETLIVHWDGTAWTQVPSPNPYPFNQTLFAVSARAADDVWAAGAHCTAMPCIAGTPRRPLIVHWNGTAWSVTPAADPGSYSTVLFTVAAVGTNDAWASGTATNKGTQFFNPTQHWDGSSWTYVPMPNPDPNLNRVERLVALGPNDSWAVGARGPAGAERTQIQHYTGPCATATVEPTATRTAVAATATRTVTATATTCALTFNDVPSGSTFYDFVRCLACRGIVGGYPCGGPGEPCPGQYYRPAANVTRGQVSKIVAEAAGFHDVVPSTQQTFEDVAPGSTFHLYVERLSTRGIIGGYPCGGAGEPCVAPTNRPYFRPIANVTRGQLAKIVAGAAGWTETPTGQTFQDVPPGSTFYLFIERMASRGIIGGYACGGAGEPCVAPSNRPYFRPYANATRGQMSKIATLAFFSNCATPSRPR